MKYLAIAVIAFSLSACSYIPPEVFTNKLPCMRIGCETGGLTYYPHEDPRDKNEPGENYELEQSQ